MTIDEKLIFHVHYTKSGIPGDNAEVGVITGTNDLTLNQLKQKILDSELIEGMSKDTVSRAVYL